MNADKARAKNKRCDCKVCLYGRVVKGLLDRQTSSRDRKLVNDLYDRLIHAEDDRDYWRIHYHGGFEAVEKSLFHKKHCAEFAKAYPKS